MSLFPRVTGVKKYSLNTGTTDNPSLTQGSPVQFNLGDIPAVEDGLANYLPGVLVTVSGNVVVSGGSGTRFSVDDLARAIFSSIEVRDGFFGYPLRAAKFLGAYLPSVEFVAGGYQKPVPQRAFFPAGASTYPFAASFFIPINYCGAIEDSENTAQLAAAYSRATMVFNIAASSVIAGISTGATLTSMTMKATALCLPDHEIRLAPGIEVADYTAPASSGESFSILSAGDDTGFDGALPGAGVLWASLLTNARGQGGAFAGNAITAFGMPWRGQRRTTHLEPFIAEAWGAMPPQRPQGSVVDSATSVALTDYAGAPHLFTSGADIAGSPINAALTGFPIVSPGFRTRLSKVQHIEGTQPVIASFGSSSGTHHLLMLQAKRWTKQKQDQYLQHLLGLGVVQKALPAGKKLIGQWTPKLAGHQGAVSAKKARYMALKLV